MKTYLPKHSTENGKWYVIDATDQTPGKIAAESARRLIGKHRPDFTPHIDLGDGIIVINAEKIRFTGSKLTDKVYRRHSGYRGNMKEISAGEMLEKHPERIIELAVKGMLPKNKLRDAKLQRLRVFVGSEHDHTAQKPETITLK